MTTKPSTLLMKYLAMRLSHGFLSCGRMLSMTEMTFVCLFPRMIRAMVPRQGAIYDIQYLMITISGLRFFISLPVFIQLNGLMEFTLMVIRRSAGAGSVEY